MVICEEVKCKGIERVFCVWRGGKYLATPKLNVIDTLYSRERRVMPNT